MFGASSRGCSTTARRSGDVVEEVGVRALSAASCNQVLSFVIARIGSILKDRTGCQRLRNRRRAARASQA
jgi:hypothetical protein